jgi:flagellum-specific ATP synthase
MTNSPVAPLIDILRTQITHVPAVQRLGTVTGVQGLIIESDGPNVGLGELCVVRSSRNDFKVRAEVVGFREHRVLLMPLGDTAGLHVGCEVAASDRPPLPRTGPEMLGRVLDALGRPFDGLAMLPIERGTSRSGSASRRPS